VTRPTVNPPNHDLFIFDIPHTPFLLASLLRSAFHMPKGIGRPISIKSIEIIQFFTRKARPFKGDERVVCILKIYIRAKYFVKLLIIS
jgi:hypothetical protein